MIQTKLYLGLGREDGPDVTMKHIRAFLAICVEPRFSSFTVYNATEYWKGVPENSTVLEIIHDHFEIDHGRSAQGIQNIARSYCLLFNKDCVGKVEHEVFSELVGQ